LYDAGEQLADEAEALVDGWRKIIGSQEHLSEWFFGPDRKPDDYKAEIALRHTPAKKNKTDGVEAPPLVPLRYVLAFAVPLLADMREHLMRKNLPVDEIERLHAAWTKAVILTLTLWSRPYTKQDWW